MPPRDPSDPATLPTLEFDPGLRPQTSLESAARVADQVWAGREPQAANLPAAEE